MRSAKIGIGCAVLGTGTIASAGVELAATMTVDNTFTASISTSPTDAGTPFLSGGNWPAIDMGSVTLDAGGTYYLHIEARDLGRPEMFIGLFTLDSADGTFANGTQSLLTNTTDWVVSTQGFGINTTAPIDLGPDGTAPWGNFGPIPDEARFIWAPNYDQGFAYFTTEIRVVPGVASVVVLGLGLGVRRRRRG